MTFFGENRASEEVKHHIHESPWTMLLPLVVLAFFSAFGGVMFHTSFVEAPEALEQLAIRNVPFAHENSLKSADTLNT